MRRTSRLMTAAALAGLASLAAMPAAARIFYVIQSGPESWTVMDAQGVEPVAGTAFKRAWAVRVQRNILAGDPPQPGYVRTLSEYDCDAHRTRWREFTVFSRSGATLVSKVNPNPEWGPSDEAGDTYAAYRVICEGVGGGSVVSADSVAKVVIGLMGAWDPPPAAALPAITAATPVAPAAKPGAAAAKPTGAAKPAAVPTTAKPAPAKVTPAKVTPTGTTAAKPPPAKAAPAKPKA